MGRLSRDWLRDYLDLRQEESTLPEGHPGRCRGIEEVHRWLGRSLEAHGLGRGGAPTSWDGWGLGGRWPMELGLVGHVVEVVAELWACMVPEGAFGLMEQDVLILILLARREGLTYLARELAESWGRPDMSTRVLKIQRTLGKAIRKRVEGGRWRGGELDTLEIGLLLHGATEFLDKRLFELDEDRLVARLDGEARLALAKVVAASAWADGKLLPEEEKAVRRFIAALNLTRGETAVALDVLKSGKVSSVPKVSFAPELARAVFMEAVWISLVDGEQAEEELEVLDKMGEALGLGHRDRDELARRVVGWYERERDLLGLAPVARASLIYARVQEKVVEVVRSNMDRILQEIRETGELSRLLVKAGSGETLTREERDKVVAQLLDIVKTIPALAVFALPGGGVILPILIKVLPFDILPSAFAQQSPEAED